MAHVPNVWPVSLTPLSPETVDSTLDKCPRAVLSHVQRDRLSSDETPAPTVHFSITADAESLGIKFWVRETHVLGKSAQDDGNGTPEVWTDSCVEFFCTHAGMGPGVYFNFEFSCVGVLLCHVGTKPARGPQADEVQRSVWRRSSLGTNPIPEAHAAPEEWTLTAIIPKSAVGVPADVNVTDDTLGLKANAYKCGDNLPHPHWVTLFPIPTDKPDFHRPDAFQPITFTVADKS